ncbi:uncharacterized protein LOC122013990 [Zingiber officinale]|uniref:uncharacterized protein LOC122013990 n=1 Tax=Zingiber officinale TaxID=94328 RepID=UPI001C4B652C|nr:uncharacterized protein LOC122013990 [Zingiber officinale]
MAIATIIATTLQEIAPPSANQNPNPPPEAQPRGIKYYYESLRKNRAPTFDGNPGPKQYYLAELRLQNLSEFENFTQALSMFVLEYSSKFNSLGTYAPTIMADDTLKLHHFKKGLSSRIQSALEIYKLTNFVDLMGAAIRAEMDIKQREDEGKNKRPLASQSFPSEQRYLGECRRISGVCFNCGKMGYRITDCPESKKQGAVSNSIAIQNKPKENNSNARVFAITREEVDNASDVVAGLRVEILSEPYRVAMPTNKALETHKLHRSCQLAKNHALVDCHRKSVKLQTPSQEEIIYHGKAKEKRLLLSASQTLKDMRSGDGIYLAMISEVEEKTKGRLEEILVVQDFLDVFPEELPGTIPNHEVDFEINLAPGVTPISNAPYRMARTKLKELKE